MDIIYYAGLALAGFGAGMMGALLGIGGGVFVVPAMVLLFHVPTLAAVGTSNVAVIATSTAGASSYVRSKLANIRLALVLLLSTSSAALVSAFVASLLPDRVFSALFVLVLGYVAFSMFRGTRREEPVISAGTDPPVQSGSLDLSGTYVDKAKGIRGIYRPIRVRLAMLVSLLAGVMAGLLGVGGGIVQMPVMNLLMRVPLRAATGTSNFMIGVTATSAAFVRYAHGDIDPLLAVPTALFVFLGARAGAWLVPRTPVPRLKLIFGWVALIIAGLMLLQALGIYKATGK